MALARRSLLALVTVVLAGTRPAPAVTIAGGGPDASDCYVGFRVRTNQRVTVNGNTVEQKACGGSCTFDVSACSQVPVASGSSCTPPTLKKVSGRAGKFGALHAPPLDAAGCGAGTTVMLTPKGTHAKKQKVTLAGIASNAKPKKDTDKALLVCDPNPSNEGCCLPPAGSRTLTVGANSHIFAIGGADAANPNTGTGSIILTMSTQAGDGSADLTVACDSVIGFQAIDGSYTCLQTQAAASSGKIYCNGGPTGVDVLVSGDSHGTGANDPPVTQFSGTAIPGAAYIRTNSRFVVCSPSAGGAGCLGALASSDDCSDPTKVDFSQAQALSLVSTTGQATSTILNPNGPANLSAPVTKTGQPFSCASFSQPGTGILETPVFLYDFPLVTADVTAVLQIGE